MNSGEKYQKKSLAAIGLEQLTNLLKRPNEGDFLRRELNALIHQLAEEKTKNFLSQQAAKETSDRREAQLQKDYQAESSKLRSELDAANLKISCLTKDLLDAQARRAGHWAKFENEKKKNAQLEKKVALLEKDNKRMATSLALRLGTAIIQAKTLKGFLRLPFAVMLAFRLHKEKLQNSGRKAIKPPLAAESKSPVNSLLTGNDKTSPEPAPPPVHKLKYTAKPPKEIRVALICDEFTYQSFAPEFTPIVLEPDTWRQQFENEKPELFLCESAWSGVDSARRPWKGRIYASENLKAENRNILLEILEYCQARGIKTVFWNKEDPAHFTDRKHDFVKTAALFDYVFTTAEECVQSYRAEYGCRNVFCLPFATQPRMFNPIETTERTQNVVFAGSWYANHLERCENMGKIFSAIKRSPYSLEIYDRFYGDSDLNHKFPAKYAATIKPNVPFAKMPSVYKSSVFGLTINTVKDSKTMFARRAFELMSSNTLVLTNWSRGMHEMFTGLVLDLEKDPDVLARLSMEEVDRLRDEALHEVLEKHTYEHRFREILDAIDLPYLKDDPTLTIVACASGEDDVVRAIRIFRKQAVPGARLLVVLDGRVRDIDAAPLFSKYNDGDINLVALSYIERYMKADNDIIETSHFALISLERALTPNALRRAMLHLCYLGDDLIALDQGEKYRFSEGVQLANVIGTRNEFRRVLAERGARVDRRFYSLGSGVSQQ